MKLTFYKPSDPNVPVGTAHDVRTALSLLDYLALMENRCCIVKGNIGETEFTGEIQVLGDVEDFIKRVA